MSENFQVQPTHFQSIKRINIVIEKLFHFLTTNIDNPVHINYRIHNINSNFFFFSSLALIVLSHISYFIFHPNDLSFMPRLLYVTIHIYTCILKNKNKNTRQKTFFSQLIHTPHQL